MSKDSPAPRNSEQAQFVVQTQTDAEIAKLRTANAELQRRLDSFWHMVENEFEIESREYFELNAAKQGDWSPEGMAVHHIWKRDAKVQELQAQVAGMREALEGELATHGHSHWDETMQRGAGCPICIAQRAAGEVSRKALSATAPRDFLAKQEAMEEALKEACFLKEVQKASADHLATELEKVIAERDGLALALLACDVIVAGDNLKRNCDLAQARAKVCEAADWTVKNQINLEHLRLRLNDLHSLTPNKESK